jgi:hypothetical protein
MQHQGNVTGDFNAGWKMKTNKCNNDTITEQILFHKVNCSTPNKYETHFLF